MFPNSFPSLLPGLPALGTRSGTPPLLSSRAKPGGSPSIRDLDLFSPLAGETTMYESLPRQRGKKFKERRWARTRDLCLASLCPGQHRFILVISKMSQDSGDARRSSSSCRPGLRLMQRITALDFQPGPVTSTPLGTLVTEEFDFRRMQLHSN